MRKKLGKKVLSGSMTVDEARAKLGRQFAQKGSRARRRIASGTTKTAEPSAREACQCLPAPVAAD